MSKSTQTDAERSGRTILSVSTQHELLAATQRRLVLDMLNDKQPPMELDEMAQRVATREHGPNPDDDTIGRVTVSLHHTHLPKLATAGIIDYDAETQRIESYQPLQ